MLCRQAGSSRAVACSKGLTSTSRLVAVRQGRRSVQCWAKTTSSRSKTASSSDSTPAPQPLQQQPLASNASKSVQGRLGGVGERVKGLVQFLTPKQEGDLGDVLMMSLSMAVLIYFSMQLYRLYAYAYFHAGSYQTMVDMMQ